MQLIILYILYIHTTEMHMTQNTCVLSLHMHQPLVHLSKFRNPYNAITVICHMKPLYLLASSALISSMSPPPPGRAALPLVSVLAPAVATAPETAAARAAPVSSL